MSDSTPRALPQVARKASWSKSIEARLKIYWNSPAILNLMYIPALLLFGIFILYPFIQGIRLSFTDWNGFSPTYNWVGLDKYQRLLSDTRVHQALFNTFFYGGVSTLLQNILGLAYALFLDQKVKGKELIRAI